MIRYLAALLCCNAIASSAHAGCGPDDQTACDIGDGQYHLSLPEPVTEGAPAVMFLHGAGSSGENVLRNKGLVNALLDRGYAVIAPTGARSFGSGNGRSWNFYPGWEGRNETQFLKHVVEDAETRFNIDPERILMSGFSAGGFMVNYLACDDPGAFAAYAPVAGGFWRPHPVECSGPVRLFHTHGWTDKTVPIEGRFLGNKRFQQGDIFAGLEIWRAANLCPDEKPTSYSESGNFLRRTWSGCAIGSALEFALFPGGHTVPKGWAGMALDWFETVTDN